MQDTDFPDAGAGSSPERTGDARVDAAMERLAGLDQLPLAAQVTVFDDVHRLLQDALTGADVAGTETQDR
ncbi:MAG: hypothetical protein QOE76_4247 [Frankiales bacterium]|jgi:hypothetical protein|nr:hypothetical protein [Frankiales bacterium]MDX6246524.1 hypothetical protein [Frankiales bacterium]